MKTSEKAIKKILEANDFIKKLGEYELLMLVDIKNIYANEKIVVDILKNNTIIVELYMKKAVVVGVTTTKDVILTVVKKYLTKNRINKFFNRYYFYITIILWLQFNEDTIFVLRYQIIFMINPNKDI